MSEIESCAVCGRTILAGERTRIFLTPEGERRGVCELCRGRAEYLGWLPEEMAAAAPPAPPRRRGGGLRGLFRPRRGPEAGDLGSGDPEAPLSEGGGGPAPAAEAGGGTGPEPAGEAGGEGGAESTPDESEAPAAEPGSPGLAEPTAARPALRPRRSPDPAAPGAGVGRPEPLSEGPSGRAERAIDRFNQSEESRTVAGLIRSLGMPWVSVGAAAGSPSEVRITVAWELSWYQWGVDIRDEARSVYPIDKGRELSELDASAQHWNAVADETGRLHPRSLATDGREAGGQ